MSDVLTTWSDGGLMFYGSSDDLIEVDGGIREEWSAEEATFRLRAADGLGGCLVTVSYTVLGCWAITVALLDEDMPIPWVCSLRSGAENGYSVSLHIACGAGTTLEHLDGSVDGTRVG